MAVETKLVQERGKFVLRGTLLESQASTTDGTWCDTHGVWPLVVTLEGTWTGTAKVYVSNAITKPTDSDNAKPQFGSDLTSNDSVSIDAHYRWVKVNFTRSTGTVNAYVAGG